MASSIMISINSDESQAFNQQLSQLSSSKPKEQAQALARLMKAMASGMHRAVVKVGTAAAAPVQASATATCASVAADDTITIGKTTLTAKASPSGENEFSQAGSDTADAAALVSKINAHSVLSKLVYASSSAGVVTITAHQPGSIGNHIVLTSSNGSRLAVTGSGYLASGAGGVEEAPVSYSLGL